MKVSPVPAWFALDHVQLAGIDDRHGGTLPDTDVIIANQLDRRNCSIGRRSERLRLRMSDHTSPTSATRPAIVRSVNVCGPTSPRSSSSHVHGAETGAPGFARTA